MPEIDTSLLESKYPKFVAQFRDALLKVENFRDDLCLTVKAESLRDIAKFLKDEPGYHFRTLMDLFGMDYDKYPKPMPERFAVVYLFYSLEIKEHLRLKVFTSEDKPEVPTLSDIYKSANWNEREAWDLFGIQFQGHPNLVRILCHNDFEGHPLRKDYPSDQYQRLKSASPSSGF